MIKNVNKPGLTRTPRFDEKYFRSKSKWHLDRNEHNDHSREFQSLLTRFCKSLTPELVTEYPNMSEGYEAFIKLFKLPFKNVGGPSHQETILLANASDEGLKSVFFHFRDRKSVSILNPTYPSAAIYTRMYGYTINEIPYRFNGKTFSFDFEKFVSSSNVLYIASPDNLTGCKITDQQVKRLVQEAAGGKIVVFDFAYEIKYAHALHNKPNVVMVGTLSKFYAGAGLRAGYISSTPEIIRGMYEFKSSYEITAPAVEYLKFVADNHKAFLKSYKRILEGKAFIDKTFKNKIKTYTNFCLFRYDEKIKRMLEKVAFIKTVTIDGTPFIRLTATDVNSFKKILKGKLKQL